MKDIRGLDLAVGQVVAFADRDGNVARMRTGTIVNLSEEAGKVSIEWEQSGRWDGPKISTVSLSGVYVDRPRICVVQV